MLNLTLADDRRIGGAMSSENDSFEERWERYIRRFEDAVLSQEQMYDPELKDLIDKLGERQDDEMRELLQRQGQEKKASDPTPELEERQEQERDDMRARFDQERKRYILEHEDAKGLLSEIHKAQEQDRQQDIDRGPQFSR